MQKLVFLGALAWGIFAHSFSLDGLAHYDCEGLKESSGSKLRIQTGKPENKSEQVLLLKKQLKESQYQVLNNNSGEKGTLIIESEQDGTFQIKVIPDGYGTGPRYKCEISKEMKTMSPKPKAGAR